VAIVATAAILVSVPYTTNGAVSMEDAVNVLEMTKAVWNWNNEDCKKAK
jgi:hypothetical protein